jgi:hypothetical protein
VSETPGGDRIQTMTGTHIIYSLFLVFTGTACLATVALYARQAVIVAY